MMTEKNRLNGFNIVMRMTDPNVFSLGYYFTLAKIGKSASVPRSHSSLSTWASERSNLSKSTRWSTSLKRLALTAFEFVLIGH